MTTLLPRVSRPAVFTLFLVPLAILGTAREGFAQSCGAAPPANCQYLMPAEGDFELAVDPMDDSVLLLTNDGTSCSTWPPATYAEAWPTSETGRDIVLRQLDTDGNLPYPALSPDNALNPHRRWNDSYAGCDLANGPEFIMPATANSDALGLVFRGKDNGSANVGLMVLERQSGAATWDDFDPEYGPIGPLTAYPSPDIVSYPTDVMYGAWAAEPAHTCEHTCAGSSSSTPVVTDIPAALASRMPPYTVYWQALHPTIAGTAVVTGCDNAGNCGLASVALNVGAGTVSSVTPKLALANPAPDGGTLGGAVFPGQTDVIWFAIDTTKHVHVIKEDSAHNFTQLFSVQPRSALGVAFQPSEMDHLSVAAGTNQLVVYTQVNDGARTGTYKMVISRNGAAYAHDNLDRFSSCEHTVEVVHSTTAGWLSYENNGNDIYRCLQPW